MILASTTWIVGCWVWNQRWIEKKRNWSIISCRLRSFWSRLKLNFELIIWITFLLSDISWGAVPLGFCSTTFHCFWRRLLKSIWDRSLSTQSSTTSNKIKKTIWSWMKSTNNLLTCCRFLPKLKTHTQQPFLSLRTFLSLLWRRRIWQRRLRKRKLTDL